LEKIGLKKTDGLGSWFVRGAVPRRLGDYPTKNGSGARLAEKAECGGGCRDAPPMEGLRE